MRAVLSYVVVSARIGFATLMFSTLALLGCTPRGLAPRTGTVEVPGGKVWYRIVGSGSRTPVLVLHGGPGVPSYYLKPLAGLSADRPVIFYDQLGCGHSPAPDDTSLWTIDRFVQELATVRQALGLDKVHLYGHSWGGTLALEYMKTHPQGVESVVMASPLVDAQQWMHDADSLKRTLPDSTQRVIELAERSGTTNSPAYQAAMMEFYQRYVARRLPWSADLDSSLAQMGTSVYMAMGGPSEFTLTGTLRDYDGRAFLRDLSVPVLYTCGEFDEAVPRSIASFATTTPGAEMRIFANAAHCTMQDDSTAYVAALRDFFQRADAKAGRR